MIVERAQVAWRAETAVVVVESPPVPMDLDRLTLPRSLPPLEHVARALLKRGAKDPGMRLLRAVVERDPREKACAALLAAVEARPEASVYGPDIDLDLRLAEVLACCGWFREALAVLEGTGLDRRGIGRSHAEALREILAPIPVGAKAALRDVDDQIRHGGAAAALATLDEDDSLPSWAIRRRVLLRRLLLESGSAHRASSPAAPLASDIRESAFAVCVRPHLEGRDLKTAYAAACALCERDAADSNARAGTDALAQLVCEAASSGASDENAGRRTRELTGLELARFQLAMGNLESVERLLRNLASEDASDVACRELLRALLVFRAALDGQAATDVGSAAVDPSDATLPGATPKAHELRDMARALVMAAEGAPLPSATGSARRASSLDDDGRDEADRAESLYGRGFAEQALLIYRNLAKRYPQRRRYADRAQDIRGTLRKRLQEAAQAAHFPGVDRIDRQSSVPTPVEDLGLGPTPPAGATRDVFGAWVDTPKDSFNALESVRSSCGRSADQGVSVVRVSRIVRVT